MPALAPYIPPKQAQFNAWLNNFSTLLSASPGTYNCTTTQADSVAAATATWNTQYAIITSPSTKTPAAISAKNDARTTALLTVRPIAQQISKDAAVATTDKTAIGVNPNTSVPTPITAPTTAPVLTIQSSASYGVILRYRDATASPSVKAKPYGVIGCQIWALPSATPVTDPTLLSFNQQATKSPTTVTMGSTNLGKTVYSAARWATRTGLVGPWSAIINYTIAG